MPLEADAAPGFVGTRAATNPRADAASDTLRDTTIFIFLLLHEAE